jgi:hypothetical protein
MPCSGHAALKVPAQQTARLVLGSRDGDGGRVAKAGRPLTNVVGQAGQADVGDASVLDQAADRDRSDVAGCRKGLCQGETDVNQR